MTAALTTCPHCGEPVAPADAFCESCGTQLQANAVAAAPAPADSVTADESARTHLIVPTGADDGDPTGAGGAAPDGSTALDATVATVAVRPCAECGGEVGADGYCTVCGVRASNGREHVVTTLTAFAAGVSDKGKVHPRNEDAMALAVAPGRTMLVVCDGVSNSTNSDVASQAAAEAALAVLVAAPAGPDSTPAVRVSHWAEVLGQAAIAGDDATATATADLDDNGNPASCTFVSAVLDGDLVVAAWVGDSRAYWLPDGVGGATGVAEQLSVDDSWATEQIAIGITREVAEADPKAHAITRWLGPDSPPVEAKTSTTTLSAPGWLLVCSDGLWNYCSAAADLADLVAGFAADQPSVDATALAESLVTWANEQGGHDNITVTLARFEPTAPLPTALPTDPQPTA